MAGLVPAIHVLLCSAANNNTWMPGTRPGMTLSWKPALCIAAISENVSFHTEARSGL
jgi:hypothetical protein